MKKKIIIFAFILLTLVTALTAQAQVTMNPELKPEYAVSITPKEGASRAAVVNIVLQMVAGSLIYAAGPIAVLMIAIGGFRYVTSHGDQNQMEEAKKTITWAIIGLFIIIISWAIVTNVIQIIASTGISGSDAKTL